MTFLNPVVLFGMLAAGIPIVIHLLNLRKLKKIEFSTLIFLKELQKNKIRKIQLKQWLLLALRVLLILLLVTAFSRPTLKGIAIGGVTSSAKTTAVFILDDTYSMSVISDNGSYFNHAKELLLAHLNQLEEGDDAVVLKVSDFKNQNSTLSKNLLEVKKSLDGSHISSVSGSLHQSIVKAAALLGSSKNFNKELYIFTDLQKTGIIRDSTYSDLSELLGERVHVYLFPFKGKEIFNIGIDSMRVNTVVFEKDKPFNVSIFVTNYAKRDVDNSVVSLFLNGERTAQKGISLRSGETVEVELESTFKRSGYQELTASLEDDDILADNNAYASVLVPDKITIGLFENETADGKYLRLALEASDSSHVFSLDERNISQLSSVNLLKYDVLFLLGDSKNLPVDKINEYLKNKKSIFIAPGTKTGNDNFNAELLSLGLPQSMSLRKTGEQSNTFDEFSAIDFEHPLLKGMFQQKEKKSVESPEYYSHFIIKNEGNGRNIITLTDKSILLAEYKIQQGKIFLFTSALQADWNNLPFKGFFVPFAFRSVFYLSAKETNDNKLVAGDDILFPKEIQQSLKIVRPDKSEEMLVLPQNEPDNLLYHNTDITGNYKVYAGKELLEIIPVNHNPLESASEYISPGDFRNYLAKLNFKGDFKEITPREDSVEAIKQARYGTELWKLFVILALIVAIIEMWVSHTAKKQLVTKE